MTISVIIPVYNVVAYLDECVNSVVTQSYKNLEILLVDDGSTDNSGALCDAWAVKDSRIRVIHKENGGAADTRNSGIEIASGEYIIFMDSDDYWDDVCAIERLVQRAQITKADVINFSFKKIDEIRGKIDVYIPRIAPMPTGISRADQLKYLSKNNLYISSPCTKLVKRSLLGGDLNFRKGVFSEDIEWCAKLMSRAQSLDFVCETFYCYRQREGSACHQYTDRKCSDLVNNILCCFACVDTADDETKGALLQYTAYQFTTFFVMQALAENYQKDMIAKMKPHTWIMKYHGGNRKIKILRMSCSLIGYTATCRLIRAAYALKRK